MNKVEYMNSGEFMVGCNYWASHAGMMMWSNWDENVVAEDLRQLAAEGLQVLRVFPLWPDFQPLQQIYGGGGTRLDLCINEKRLLRDDELNGGVSQQAMNKFTFLADTAQKEGLTLIVGLVTGWMSGRLFVPPAFEGLNVITDPLAIKWQSRFVRTFVREFKTHPAIGAWDLGNECNCMGYTEKSEQAWVWTSTIAGSIRQEDNTRPVISGMHSLSANNSGNWLTRDQGELTDILTTHPYPIFTPYCDQDPVNELRNGFHATAECRLYSDTSGRPCFAEEMGTLGPMVASEEVAADYTRSALFTLWAHDCRAMLWWCAYDQMHLDFAPYEQNDCERELGLIGNDRRVKPVLKEIKAFRKAIENLPFPKLPPCKREAVCIITDGQDAWAAAYSSYILAKQAGFDIRFRHVDSELPDSQLYILPSINGFRNLDNRLRRALREKVENGSALYVSFGDAFFEPFKEFFGLEVVRREMKIDNDICFEGLRDKPVLKGKSAFRHITRESGAKILGREDNGNISFACNHIGKGKVYYLSFPLEQMLSHTPGAFHGDSAQEYFRIYQQIGSEVIEKRLVQVQHPSISVTEHHLENGQVVAVIINHCSQPIQTGLDLTSGWQIDQILIGENISPEQISINVNDGAVLLLRKTHN